MPRQPNDPDEKADALRLAGAYHAHADAIRAPEFHVGGFFDPRYSVQVKYEMLRRVREEQAGVTEAAKLFGFSRIRYYQVLRAFRREGFAGLLPRPMRRTRAVPTHTRLTQARLD